MNRALLARTWLVATALAAIGLLAGLVAANVVTGREPQRYVAEATLAMLPSQQVPVTQAPSFWEVLSRGQATRSAAIMLADHKWIETAASAAGVPAAQLSIEAGAIPDTTLIRVDMRADSASAAEVGLAAVLDQASKPAAAATGPFRLEVVASPAGSAQSLQSSRLQMYAALGIAGLLVGTGLGLLIGKPARRKAKPKSTSGPPPGTNGRVPERSAVSFPSR